MTATTTFLKTETNSEDLTETGAVRKFGYFPEMQKTPVVCKSTDKSIEICVHTITVCLMKH